MNRPEFLLQHAWIFPLSMLICVVFGIAAIALSPRRRQIFMKRVNNAPGTGPDSLPVLACTCMSFFALFCSIFYGLLYAAKEMNLNLVASSVGGLTMLITVAILLAVSKLFKLNLG